MKALTHDHLKEELIISSKREWHFNLVKSNANRHALELSDEDFRRLLFLSLSGVNAEQIIKNMSRYKQSLVDVLVTYLVDGHKIKML